MAILAQINVRKEGTQVRITQYWFDDTNREIRLDAVGRSLQEALVDVQEQAAQRGLVCTVRER
jgi:hypothetical protein